MFYTKDPDKVKDKPFGAFMYNVDRQKHVYDDTDAPLQEILEPKNNEFKDITFTYNTYTRIMTIKYDKQVWSRNISDWLVPGVDSYGFGSASSTGTYTNLQQFQIEEMVIEYMTTPTRPVDKDGKEISHKKTFPEYRGVPGDKITIEPKDIPDLPGYRKPTEPIEAIIPNIGEVIDIPYQKILDIASRPVNPDGIELPHDGIEFPTFSGVTVDKITIDPSEIPNIPGYNKPKEPFEVTIPKEGGIIDIPYTPREKYTETPSIPVDPNGKEIPHKGIEFQRFPGKPGEEIEIDPSELPNIPGYNKPKELFIYL